MFFATGFVGRGEIIVWTDGAVAADGDVLLVDEKIVVSCHVTGICEAIVSMIV